jgi:Outer membrane lipoprotein-sorting protein
MRTRFLAASVVLALATAAATDTPPLSCKQITDRLAEMDAARAASLRGYSAMRHYVLDNPRLHVHAEMIVRMTYTAPARKEFKILSESGTLWIRNHVFRKLMQAEQEGANQAASIRLTAANYNFRLVGTEKQNDRPCYVLDAEPKTKNKYLFRGRVWIDAEDAAVARIDAHPAQNPSFWTTNVHFVHQYEKIGPYWLAASNVSKTEVRVFGTTDLKIDYYDYSIQ